MDTGPMLIKKALSIEPQDTSASLYEKLANIGPIALLETLEALFTLKPENQDDSLASYAHKLSKQEARIDWQLGAKQLARNVRAFNPWPGAYFEIQGAALKVWQARVTDLPIEQQGAAPGQILKADKQGVVVATTEQAILLKIIQLPGKKPLPVIDILNGRADWFKVGSVLS